MYTIEPSYKFTALNHCGNLSYSIFDLWNFDKNEPMPNWRIVGYIPAKRLNYRPGKGKYGVLLERIKLDDIYIDDDRLGEIVWLHITYLTNEEFLNYVYKDIKK